MPPDRPTQHRPRVYLGVQVQGSEALNHASDAVFDESVLATGAALHLMAGDGFWSLGGEVGRHLGSLERRAVSRR